ncbi:S-formylglutathione hydrolase FrmB [Streptoalloteichus tenebrarius]|uniref:Acyl-CoA:diacylglycerol acyltransferase n=2 Tax=Streptoalloteichus tenebrarius (strain ATCC 17920 / DSM 40477 / JCM 4838 / CBS 697.72 / NBRC 16177 / NCIMB 11028 / NRRL B-12390 / A12253. 1 / ISP 5477) TaxID=1933 RepID=A0ABT1HX77_STRSD|nr:S-formylglutathione hydrolase FrmB [Streptoalloteichus tenebrarius]
MRERGDTTRRGMSRRVLLGTTVAAGTTALAGLVLTSATRQSEPPSVARRAATSGPDPARAGVVIDRVYSAARRREIDLVTIYPRDIPRRDLPVCLMLHGRFGNARAIGTLPEMLSSAVSEGAARPYAFVTVDGGNSYWHRNRPDDDPMTMLLEEVPRWLAERRLGGAAHRPFAVAGISMGGFGALLYARRRRERRDPVRAVAAISPALLLSWREMRKRDAFPDASDWAASDPLRNIDKLGDVPVGVWCGTEDRFIEGTRRFIREAKPVIGSTGPGAHNDDYYRRVLPEAIRFVGRHV